MKSIVVASIGVAFGIAVAWVFQSSRAQPLPAMTAAEVGAIVQRETAQLHAQIEQLQRQLEALPAAAAPAPSPVREETKPPSSSPPPSDLAPILARLDALQARFDAVFHPLIDASLVDPKQKEVKVARLRDAQRVATDRNATEKDRIDALKALRGVQNEDGTDARTHDVVVSLLEIAENSANEEARVDVYRNLHGTNDATLKDSMVRALTQDSSAKVREKVAEDIDTFLDDPEVERALRAVADADADPTVRGRALRTMTGKRK